MKLRQILNIQNQPISEYLTYHKRKIIAQQQPKKDVIKLLQKYKIKLNTQAIKIHSGIKYKVQVIRQNQKIYQIYKVYFKYFFIDIKLEIKNNQYFLRNHYKNKSGIIYKERIDQFRIKIMERKNQNLKNEIQDKRKFIIECAIKKLAGILGLTSKIIQMENNVDIQSYMDCYIYKYEYFDQANITDLRNMRRNKEQANQQIQKLKENIRNCIKILNCFRIQMNNYTNFVQIDKKIEYNCRTNTYVYRHFDECIPIFTQRQFNSIIDLEKYQKAMRKINSLEYNQLIQSMQYYIQQQYQAEVSDQEQQSFNNPKQELKQQLIVIQKDLYDSFQQKYKYLNNIIVQGIFKSLKKKLYKKKYKSVLLYLLYGLYLKNEKSQYKISVETLEFAFKKWENFKEKYKLLPIMNWFRIQYAQLQIWYISKTSQLEKVIEQVKKCMNILLEYYVDEDQLILNNLIILIKLYVKNLILEADKQRKNDLLRKINKIIQHCDSVKFFNKIQQMNIFKLKITIINGYIQQLIRKKDLKKRNIYFQQSCAYLQQLDISSKYRKCQNCEKLYGSIILNNQKFISLSFQFIKSLFNTQSSINIPWAQKYIIIAKILSIYKEKDMMYHVTLTYLEQLYFPQARKQYLTNIQPNQIINLNKQIKQPIVQAYLYFITAQIYFTNQDIILFLFWLIEALEVIKYGQNLLRSKLLGLIFLSASRILDAKKVQNILKQNFLEIAQFYLHGIRIKNQQTYIKNHSIKQQTRFGYKITIQHIENLQQFSYNQFISKSKWEFKSTYYKRRFQQINIK